MGWTIFFMMVILKIPLLAALYLVWWAVKAEPEIEPEGPTERKRKPRPKPPSLPRFPRRGPAGGADCPPPPCPQLAERPLWRPGPVIARRD